MLNFECGLNVLHSFDNTQYDHPLTSGGRTITQPPRVVGAVISKQHKAQSMYEMEWHHSPVCN
jgi:hypothetical protein